MPTAPLDLWPNDLGATDVVPPVVILRQQAALLGTRFKYAITGEVQSDDIDGKFLHGFYIVAPALGDYHYLLFSIIHGIELYPLAIQGVKDMTSLSCNDEQTFIGSLQGIFQSEWTRKVIASLLAQSQATPEKALTIMNPHSTSACLTEAKTAR